MKKRDVGIVKRFSKNYGNKGINYLQSESYIKMPVSLITSLPQEQVAKTDMLSVVSIQVFVLCTVEEGVAMPP